MPLMPQPRFTAGLTSSDILLTWKYGDTQRGAGIIEHNTTFSLSYKAITRILPNEWGCHVRGGNKIIALQNPGGRRKFST